MTTTTGSEPDLPLAGLQPANRVLLRDSPLQVVVAEVRWVRTTVELSEELGLDLRDLAGEHGLHFAHIEPVQQQQVQVNVTLEGPRAVVETASVGLKFTTADGITALTVMPDSLVVQCNDYRRFANSLAPQVAAAAAAVSRIMAPTVTQRVGLRYVNRLNSSEAASPQFWRDRIAPSFLGPLLHTSLGTFIVGAQQQVELQLSETAGAIVRHGPYKEDSAASAFSYLLDIDVYDARSDRFDLDALAILTRRLNRTAASLFQAIVSEAWRDTMGPYADEQPQRVATAGSDPGSNGEMA